MADVVGQRFQDMLAAECDLNLPEGLFRTCELLHVIFNEIQADHLESGWAQAVLDDLLAAKSRFPQLRDYLDFIQFDVWVSMAMLATGRKQMNAVRRALIFAISDDRIEEGDLSFEVQRLPRFAAQLFSPVVIESLILYFDCLYYYSRVIGDLREIAARLSLFAGGLLLRLLPQEDAVHASLMLCDWSIVNGTDIPSGVVQKLRDIERTEVCPLDALKSIRVAFATRLGETLGLDTRAFARAVLEKHGGALHGHEKVQIMAALFRGDIAAAVREREGILRAIDEYDDAVRDAFPNPALYGYEKARSFAVIQRLVIELIQQAETGFAIEILRHWSGYKLGTPRDAILVAPSTKQGVAYAHGSRGVLVGRERPAEGIGDLVRAINRFHSVNIFINDEPAFVPTIYNRPGIPDQSREGGDDYRAEIESTFALAHEEVLKFLKDAPNAAMATVPWLNIPIQAVVAERASRTYPLSITLTQPASDRKIRKVLVWWANTFIGARSMNWVRDAFGSAGIETVAVGLGEGTLLEFQSKYSDSTFDVVWLIGHGEWNGSDYHLSRFSVTEQEQPSLEWWATLPQPHGRRRLLVLDLCDSGTVAVTGGMLDLGLPPLLVSPTQAVLGNLWPIDQLSSAICGTLLALALTEGNAYFNAYENALRLLRGDKRDCIEYLSQRLGSEHDAISAMQMTSIDFQALAHRGALAFFE